MADLMRSRAAPRLPLDEVVDHRQELFESGVNSVGTRCCCLPNIAEDDEGDSVAVVRDRTTAAPAVPSQVRRLDSEAFEATVLRRSRSRLSKATHRT
jgi:hypothetical protein